MISRSDSVSSSDARGHDAADGLGRQILQGGYFGVRETAGAQARVGGVDDLLRRGKAAVAAGFDEARENAFGRDAVQLLMGDGAHQRFERRVIRHRLRPITAGGRDQTGHDRIGLEDFIGGARRHSWQPGQ